MKVIEQLLANAGISPIAGVDEAGRGACAGPLVIASVVLNDPFAAELAVVRDSKEIAESKRDAVFELIHQVAASVSVVIVPSSFTRCKSLARSSSHVSCNAPLVTTPDESASHDGPECSCVPGVMLRGACTQQT